MSLRSAFLACCVLAFAGIPANRACAETIQLTDSDQDEIAETVLVYSQNYPATYLGENGVTSGYLMVRGDDPSSDLLEKLQKDGFAFMPLSEAAHRAGYTMSIGAFAPISSGTAQGVLFAYNRGTGGATENYIGPLTAIKFWELCWSQRPSSTPGSTCQIQVRDRRGRVGDIMKQIEEYEAAA